MVKVFFISLCFLFVAATDAKSVFKTSTALYNEKFQATQKFIRLNEYMCEEFTALLVVSFNESCIINVLKRYTWGQERVPTLPGISSASGENVCTAARCNDPSNSVKINCLPTFEKYASDVGLKTLE